MIWNTLISWFNNTIDELINIQKIWIQNIHINQEMLEELRKQTIELEKINEKLLMPWEIRSNEHFKVWMHRIEIKNWKRSLEEFEKWIIQKNDHLFNLYGAWLSSNFLWKTKQSIIYFTDAYDIAIDKWNYKLAWDIAFDTAKLHIKNLNLIEGKTRLDKTIENNMSNVEAYFLKARICNLLNQNWEFELLINVIFNKIINDWVNFNLKENYEDILEYLYKPTNDIVNEEIQAWLTKKLLEMLPKLESIWHNDAIKNILSYIVFQQPYALSKSWINISDILKNNKDFFEKKYEEFLNKDLYGGNPQKILMIAYLWYKIINFDILKKVIDKSFSIDLNYIDLKNTNNKEEKEKNKKILTDKFYEIWKNWKYMLRDYLKYTPDSLFYK